MPVCKQSELQTAEEEEAGDRDKGQPLHAQHQSKLPAVVVQHGDRLAQTVDEHHQDAEEQVQQGELFFSGSLRHTHKLLVLSLAAAW